MIDDKKLISRILASELIDQSVLEKGLDLADQRGASLYETLIFAELVEEATVVAVASKILNVPYIQLSNRQIDGETAALISPEMASANKTVPVELIDDDGVEVLKLAMIDPIDVMAMDEIASHTGIDIHPVLAGPADVEAAIERLYGDDEAIEFDEIDEEDIIEVDDDEIIELDEVVEDEQGLEFGGGADDDSVESEYGAVEFGGEEFDDEFDFAEGDGDFDDGIELEDDDDLLQQAGVADDPPSSAASEGLGQQADSWAAMFDDPEDAAEPVSIDGSESSDADFSPPPEFEEAENTNASDTQIGSPAHIGKWGEDDLADDSGEQSAPKDEKSAPKDEQSAPKDDDAQQGQQEHSDDEGGAWEWDGIEIEELEESEPDLSVGGDEASSPTRIGLGARGDIEELSFDDAEFEDEPGGDESLDAPSSTPGAEADHSSVDAKAGDSQPTEGGGRSDGDQDKRSAVPSSVRDILSKKADDDEDGTEDKSKQSPSLPRPDDIKASKNKDDSDNDGIDNDGIDNDGIDNDGIDEPSTLGRIDVKQVAVPSSSFKGAIEKRSDRQGRRSRPESKRRKQTKSRPASNDNDSADEESSIATQTREMSVATIADLAGGDSDESPSVELPDDLDSRRILRGLIELMIERDLLSAADIQDLIDRLS